MLLRFATWCQSLISWKFDLYEIDLSTFSFSRRFKTLVLTEIDNMKFNKHGYGDYIVDNTKSVDFHNRTAHSYHIYYDEFLALNTNYSESPFPYQEIRFSLTESYTLTLTDKFIDGATVIGFSSALITVYNPLNTASRSCNSFITFHHNKTLNKSYFHLYIPIYYFDMAVPRYITYYVYKIDLTVQFTNCCLQQCVEPTKYIYYKG